MKIKYRCNYKDGTDWSKSSTYNILALDQLGHEVELEEISYNNGRIYTNPRIQELEGSKSDKHDIVFSHVLPMHFTNFPDVKNVGIVALETKTLENRFWLKKIRITNNIVSGNESTKDTLKKYGIESTVFNPLFDFDHVFSSPVTVNIPHLKTGFNFLFHGDSSTVKNLEATLKAFHTEFLPFEKVNLVIISDNANTEEFCNSVKKKLKLSRRAKREIIVTGPLRDNDKYSIMRHCHVTVNSSYGESWSYPTLEGLALGLPVIYCEDNGLDDILKNDYSLSVSSNKVMCYGANDSFDDLQTSTDTWQEVNVSSLKCQMRLMFIQHQNQQNEFLEMRQKATNASRQYDYKNEQTLQRMSDLLETIK